MYVVGLMTFMFCFFYFIMLLQAQEFLSNLEYVYVASISAAIATYWIPRECAVILQSALQSALQRQM